MRPTSCSLQPLGEALIAAGALVFVLTLLAYADTLRRVCGQPLPAAAKTHSAFVVSVYPVVSIATLCALMVPRAQLLAEAITQMVFMAAVYQLWCLLVAYCGGETKLVLRVEPSQLDTRVGPCCCWPCCPLPRLPVNKRALMLLRGLVIQLPVVQGLLYLIMLVIWAEEESLYEVHYMYLQPVVIASILTGIWGLIMTLRMLGPVLSEHRLVGKFLVLQAVLLLSKFQALGARGLAWYRLLPCNPPLTPTVYASLLYNVAMLVEMLLLAVAARAVYSKEVPALSDSIPVVSTVSLRDTHHAQSDRITVAPASESNNNNAKMSYKL